MTKLTAGVACVVIHAGGFCSGCTGDSYSLGGLKALSAAGSSSASGSGGDSGASAGGVGGADAGPAGSGGTAGGIGGAEAGTGSASGSAGRDAGPDAGGAGGDGGEPPAGAVTFVGVVEGESFASGSNAIRLELGEGWPASQTGVLVLGVPGFEIPPTDPEKAVSDSGPSGSLYEGYAYRMSGSLTVTGGQLAFDVLAGDIWDTQCRAQTPFPNPDIPSGFSCLPPGDFTYPAPCSIGGQPFACASIALCNFLGACVCASRSCGPDPSQAVRFSLTLSGAASDERLEGEVLDLPPGTVHRVRLTRQ